VYRLVGTVPGAGGLLDLLPRLELLDRPGYQVTRKGPTIELVRPRLADYFPGRWMVARFAVVKPGGLIPPHTDPRGPTDPPVWRLLVVQTSPDAWVMHAGDWQRLEPDGVYEADQSAVHAAVNFGKEPRVHLVVGTE
jgi:hypothetical protein